MTLKQCILWIINSYQQGNKKSGWLKKHDSAISYLTTTKLNPAINKSGNH